MMQVVWIPANGAMLILFLSIFVPHFENIFIHFPNAQQEQRNKRIFWLLFYHMLNCNTCGLHSIPLSLKCHHNYQQFIRNVDKKNIEMLPMKIPFFFFEVWNEFFLPNINFKDGRWGIKPKKCVLHFCPHSYILGEKEYFWQLTTSPLRTLHLATISLVSIQYISFKGVLLCFSVQFCIL